MKEVKELAAVAGVVSYSRPVLFCRALFKGLGPVSESTLFLLRLVSVSDGENLRFNVKTLTAGDNDNEETIRDESHPAPPDLFKYALIKNLNPLQLENNLVLVSTSQSLGLVLVPVFNVTNRKPSAG